MNFKQIKHKSFFINFLKEKKNLRKLNINFCGRSGSYFLHKLLDGHSNIITFHQEYDIYIYQNLKNFFFNKKKIETLPEFLRNNLKKDFHNHLNIWGTTKLNVNVDEICDEIHEMISSVDIINYNLDLLIDIFFLAHTKINIDYIDCENPFVLLQTHAPFENQERSFYFKNVNIFKFFIMMRDPVKSIDSHFFHHLEEHIIPPKETLFTRLFYLFSESVKLIRDKKFGKKIFVCKFENLHLKSIETLNIICDQLDIGFQKILLKETNLAKDTESIKKKTEQKIQNFRQLSLPEDFNNLSNIQVKMIEKKFDDIFKFFKYKKRNLSESNCILLTINYLLKVEKDYLVENIDNLIKAEFCNSFILRLFKIKKYF